MQWIKNMFHKPRVNKIYLSIVPVVILRILFTLLLFYFLWDAVEALNNDVASARGKLYPLKEKPFGYWLMLTYQFALALFPLYILLSLRVKPDRN
jgi:hypothetical protein